MLPHWASWINRKRTRTLRGYKASNHDPPYQCPRPLTCYEISRTVQPVSNPNANKPKLGIRMRKAGPEPEARTMDMPNCDTLKPIKFRELCTWHAILTTISRLLLPFSRRVRGVIERSTPAKGGGRAGRDGLERFGMPPHPGSRRTPWRHSGDTTAFYASIRR
jgi:hypothetical protein